jgi:hypothetical protein
MSNFTFLEKDWTEFVNDAKAMERLVHFDPKAACGRTRHLIEQVVLWMYENDEVLKMPYDTSFYNITILSQAICRSLYSEQGFVRCSSKDFQHQQGCEV